MARQRAADGTHIARTAKRAAPARLAMSWTPLERLMPNSWPQISSIMRTFWQVLSAMVITPGVRMG